MITLKEIAKKAGVSVMTVSRVVNKQYSKVSNENIERIQKLIDQYGYVPNYSARSLSSQNSKIVVIIMRGESEGTLENPHNAKMLGRICADLQEAGYFPMLHSVNTYEDIYIRLRNWKADGAIFFGIFDYEIAEIQQNNQIPMVFIDSYSKMRQITNVGIDDYKGGQLAARHFLENGHRHLALIHYGIEHEGVERQRFLGFSETLEEAGLTLSGHYMLDSTCYKIENLPKLLHRLFEGNEKTTGIFVTADRSAIEVIDHLRQMGVRVPQDCSIIGFDDLFFSPFLSPHLTTIRQDISLKAQSAVRLLLRQIETPSLPKENIVLDVKLIARDSVANLKEK